VVAEVTLKLSEVPPMLTALAPPRLVPITVTDADVPVRVDVLLYEVTVGTTRLVEGLNEALDAVPPPVVTAIAPAVFAPEGTAVTMLVDDSTVNGAEVVVPANFTDLVSSRLVPVMVTAVPTPPEATLIELMVGRPGMETVAAVEVAEPTEFV
jgi:hypothetical protein